MGIDTIFAEAAKDNEKKEVRRESLGGFKFDSERTRIADFADFTDLLQSKTDVEDERRRLRRLLFAPSLEESPITGRKQLLGD